MKEKEIKIGTKSYIIRALRIRQIRQNIMEKIKGKDIFSAIETLLREFSDIPEGEFDNCTADEILDILNAFMEVNASFFVIPERLGVISQVNQVKKFAAETLSKFIEALLNQGTELREKILAEMASKSQQEPTLSQASQEPLTIQTSLPNSTNI